MPSLNLIQLSQFLFLYQNPLKTKIYTQCLQPTFSLIMRPCLVPWSILLCIDWLALLAWARFSQDITRMVKSQIYQLFLRWCHTQRLRHTLQWQWWGPKAKKTVYYRPILHCMYRSIWLWVGVGDGRPPLPPPPSVPTSLCRMVAQNNIFLSRSVLFFVSDIQLHYMFTFWPGPMTSTIPQGLGVIVTGIWILLRHMETGRACRHYFQDE